MVVAPILAILTTLAMTVALPESTLSADSAPSLATTQQITGRDVYSPDVLADPSGSGYIMWYGGWQTQQTVDSGQFDTIYRRTAPTPTGPWSDPITEIVASQVAPQITEVNDPSVSITSVNGTLQYTMFFTSLQCKPGHTGMQHRPPAGGQRAGVVGHLRRWDQLGLVPTGEHLRPPAFGGRLPVGGIPTLRLPSSGWSTTAAGV